MVNIFRRTFGYDLQRKSPLLTAADCSTSCPERQRCLCTWRTRQRSGTRNAGLSACTCTTCLDTVLWSCRFPSTARKCLPRTPTSWRLTVTSISSLPRSACSSTWWRRIGTSEPPVAAFIRLARVQWCGTSCSSTPSVTGSRRPLSTWSGVSCVRPDASHCSVPRLWWMTTWWGGTRPSRRRPCTTSSTIR